MYNRWVSGYGLVVEHVLAKDEIRVRFPVAAQKNRRFLSGNRKPERELPSADENARPGREIL